MLTIISLVVVVVVFFFFFVFFFIARLSTTWQFNTSNHTAGHGLKWTKGPAVRNVHQNATERLLQTSKEY